MKTERLKNANWPEINKQTAKRLKKVKQSNLMKTEMSSPIKLFWKSVLVKITCHDFI